MPVNMNFPNLSWMKNKTLRCPANVWQDINQLLIKNEACIIKYRASYSLFEFLVCPIIIALQLNAHNLDLNDLWQRDGSRISQKRCQTRRLGESNYYLFKISWKWWKFQGRPKFYYMDRPLFKIRKGYWIWYLTTMWQQTPLCISKGFTFLALVASWRFSLTVTHAS